MPDFVSLYQKHLPFVAHGLQSHFKELLDLPLLTSLESLLHSWPTLIQAHLPDVRDELSSVDTTPKDAVKLFANGMGLLFNEAQNVAPVLKEWLEKIRKDLGLSALTYGRCLIYATPNGKGTAPHFDQNINFVLQIHGIKKWIMAPNEHVAHPMTRHTMGQETDSELKSYLEVPLPNKMPKDTKTFELHPGSLLYVPRGYWHETEAKGDALALNFTFTAPTWIDLLTTALRGRLALSPEWRETAEGVSDPLRFEQAAQTFDELLVTLKHDLPHWRAHDILGVTEPDLYN